MMRLFQKTILIILVVSFVVGSGFSGGWAWDKWDKKDPVTDEWNAADLVVARPLGVATAILGAGMFSVSLPFTITVDIFSRLRGSPPNAVRDSAKILMLDPLKFSFVREFPDENM